MARRPRGALDDDDAASRQATALDLRPLPAVEADASLAKPDDSTLPASPSGYRIATAVESFSVAFKDARAKVTDGVASLGSHAGNTLVVADPTVSRFHAEIR
ncbi:MAG: FHA domain-containing protein, partial [Myxococcales bacterium]|nr:FHA domain-containing protein [Myxococcales bacterium]